MKTMFRYARVMFLATFLLALYVSLALADESQPYWSDRREIPVSGVMPSGFGAFDDVVRAVMVRHDIPCASLTITHNGKVVINRAYGYKNKARTKPLPTGTLFRMASLDKMVFHTAVERMMAEGVHVKATGEPFTRDLKIFRSLQKAGILSPELTNIDPRLYDVTVGQLCDHTSGIEVYYPSIKEVQGYYRITRLPTGMEFLKFKVNRKLKYDPGTHYEYNNTGNELLWYILQWVAGDWRKAVGKYVFTPAGTREIGISKTRPKERSRKEVWYSTRWTAPSIFPEDHGKLLPVTDGGATDFDMTLIASSEALARYLSTWYMGTGRPLVDAQGNLAKGNDNGYGVYYGSWDGTWSMMLQRRWTLTNVVVLFNHREERQGVESTDLSQAFSVAMDRVGW
jgi:CubicO group peptidase (beta-lactamase class C family)